MRTFDVVAQLCSLYDSAGEFEKSLAARLDLEKVATQQHLRQDNEMLVKIRQGVATSYLQCAALLRDQGKSGQADQMLAKSNEEFEKTISVWPTADNPYLLEKAKESRRKLLEAYGF